jgi:hypothetical protein
MNDASLMFDVNGLLQSKTDIVPLFSSQIDDAISVFDCNENTAITVVCKQELILRLLVVYSLFSKIILLHTPLVKVQAENVTSFLELIL